MIKEIIDQLMYYQIYQKFLKISWISRSLHTSKLFFSKQWTGFSRSFNVSYYLLVTPEKFRKALDKSGDYTALLTDLSRAFDCITHDLIIAKLHEYEFELPLLIRMNSYLMNIQQRVKINISDCLTVFSWHCTYTSTKTSWYYNWS